MIPKIIHYCWFGGNPLPPLAIECIASWKKFLPDYEIWQWCEASCESKNEDENEDESGELKIKPDKVMTFDVNSIPYTAEAYRQKKFAYVSDYARLAIMYEYGGLYFDTDVEIIRSIDDIIEKGGFLGFEQDTDGGNTPGVYAPRFCFGVNPGLGFGMSPNHPFMADMVEHYKSLKFEPIPEGDIAWYKTIVAHTTEKLCARGLRNITGIQQVDDMYVYPSEYFAPINAITRRIHITENTRTIHRYMASWSEQKNKSLRDYVMHFIPEWLLIWNNKRKRKYYRVNDYK